jgi:hypothetical protein
MALVADCPHKPRNAVIANGLGSPIHPDLIRLNEQVAGIAPFDARSIPIWFLSIQ